METDGDGVRSLRMDESWGADGTSIEGLLQLLLLPDTSVRALDLFDKSRLRHTWNWTWTCRMLALSLHLWIRVGRIWLGSVC